MDSSSEARRPARSVILFAFAALYILWGSTYLSIAIAIESIPPLLMAGARFVSAGVILLAFLKLRGEAWPQAEHWRAGLFTGILLLLFGNGGVTWAEQWVASSVTALIIATTPLWTVLLPWLFRRGPAPSFLMALGIGLGLCGVGVLVWSASGGDEHGTRLTGAIVIVFATLAWAVGSLWSKILPQPPNPLMTCALQMLCGGASLLAGSLVRGEWLSFAPQAITTRSWLAFVYLVFFGAIGGFGAFVFLLRWCPPAQVFTYAYVNPLVAVVMGWLILNEPLGPLTLVAASLIVAGVVIIVRTKR